MAKVVKINPEHITPDGKPTFRPRLPDPSKMGETYIKVEWHGEYEQVQVGDTIEVLGSCFEVLNKQAAVGGDGNGIITFVTDHKRQIPC